MNKLNAEKREVIAMCAPHIKNKFSMGHTQLDNTIVRISTVVKNIGVFLDDALSINSHVRHVCRVTCCHRQGNGRVRNILDWNTTETSTHQQAVPSHSRNNLLYGIASDVLNKLHKECKTPQHVS